MMSWLFSLPLVPARDKQNTTITSLMNHETHALLSITFEEPIHPQFYQKPGLSISNIESDTDTINNTFAVSISMNQ